MAKTLKVNGEDFFRHAFEYTCEACGRNCFLPGVRPDFLSPDDIAEYKDQLDIPADQEGDFLTAPLKFTCPHCDTHYEVEWTEGIELGE